MSAEDVLTQEEIDTLLEGADDIADRASSGADGEIIPYDIFNPGGRLPPVPPRLITLMERAAERFGTEVGVALGSTCEAFQDAPAMRCYADLLAEFEPPVLLCVAAVPALDGHAMVVLDVGAVDVCIDALFGGSGRPLKRSVQVFSPAEQRIARTLTSLLFGALQAAGKPLENITADNLRVEFDPERAALCDARDPVVVARFALQLDSGAGGAVWLVMPDSLFDSVRDLLGVEKQIASEDDARWQQAMQDNVGTADVEVYGRIGGVRLTLREVLGLRTGDFIPIDRADQLTLYAGATPILRGALGTHEGRHAVRVTTAPASSNSKH